MCAIKSQSAVDAFPLVFLGHCSQLDAEPSEYEIRRISKIAMQMFVSLQYPMYTSKFAAEGCPSG